MASHVINLRIRLMCFSFRVYSGKEFKYRLESMLSGPRVGLEAGTSGSTERKDLIFQMFCAISLMSSMYCFSTICCTVVLILEFTSWLRC
jgi:hypothetical protein